MVLPATKQQQLPDFPALPHTCLRKAAALSHLMRSISMPRAPAMPGSSSACISGLIWGTRVGEAWGERSRGAERGRGRRLRQLQAMQGGTRAAMAGHTTPSAAAPRQSGDAFKRNDGAKPGHAPAQPRAHIHQHRGAVQAALGAHALQHLAEKGDR